MRAIHTINSKQIAKFGCRIEAAYHQGDTTKYRNIHDLLNHKSSWTLNPDTKVFTEAAGDGGSVLRGGDTLIIDGVSYTLRIGADRAPKLV